jgi:cold shock protein
MKMMENDNVDSSTLPTYEGTVIWMNHGIGFIKWEKDGIPQRDMFVHFSDIKMEGYRNLFKDQKVSFQIGTNKNGDPKGINVCVITTAINK